MSDWDVMERYGGFMKMAERLPDVLSKAMGNQMFVAVFDTKKELDGFYKNILECRKEE